MTSTPTLKSLTCIDCGTVFQKDKIQGFRRNEFRCAPCSVERRRLNRNQYEAAKRSEHAKSSDNRCIHPDGCQRASMLGVPWCSMHYYRLLNKGSVGPAESYRRRVGHKSVDAGGYVYVYSPEHAASGRKGRIAEHRLVMEQKIGRPLLKRESVHHINGIRADNRPENLELWVRPQPSGQRPEDLVRWVVQHYPELVAEAMRLT